MSKKTILNESQVRQFMKLAKLEPLTPGFVEGLSKSADEELEESHGNGKLSLNQVDDGLGRRRDRAGVMEEADPAALEDYAAGDLDRDHPEEAAEDELEADVELDALPEDEGRMVSVDEFLGALETALEQVMGDEVEIDTDEVEDEVEADVELAAADDELDVEVEEELEEGTKKGDEDKGGDEACVNENTDELVEQITKRVAARILKSALSKK